VRVTLDTNVYVSALNFSGRAARLLGMALAGVIRIDISPPIEHELIRVLREDFDWDGYRIQFLRERLAKLTNRVTPALTLKVSDDPDDDRILECAVAAGSDFIVTQDKARLRLRTYEGIRIVRVRLFGPQAYEYQDRALGRRSGIGATKPRTIDSVCN
jgi:putative PIN family toxin of toxin-antitoxin system